MGCCSKTTTTTTAAATGRRAQLAAFILIVIAFSLHSVLVSYCFFIDERQSPSQHEWSYSQQQDWAHEHRQCAGKAQSPINIQNRNVIVNNHLRLHFYNYNQFIKFKMQNAHHTIKMNPIESSYLGSDANGRLRHKALQSTNPLDANDTSSSLTDILTADEDLEPEYETTPRDPKSIGRGQPGPSKGDVVGYKPNSHLHGQINDGNNNLGDGSNEVPPYGGAPSIKLDWLDDGNNEYKLRDIHFHWGERRDNGSEHAIEGKRAAMEMHLVHVKHGLEKSKIGFTSDSVAVVAVLIESYRRSNADFNPIVNTLGRINMTDQAQEIEYKALKDLLPSATTNFYTYSGSLTTPPCYQVVNWIVMHDRLYLNAKQIEMFRNLYAPQNQGDVDHDGLNLIMPNIRQIQPLSNRTILASFSPYGRLEQIQIANSPQNGAISLVVMERSVLLLLALCWSLLLRNVRSF